MNPPNQRGEPERPWPEYQRLVLYRLDKLEERGERLEEKLDTVENHVSLIRWKTALISATIGMIVSAVTTAVALKMIH